MSRRTYQLLALALTLSGTSACDEAPGAFGAGEVALRPGGFGSGGVLINTSATGDWAVPHLDLNFGSEIDGVILESVIVKGKEKFEEVKLEKVWVTKGQIFGQYQNWVFSGAEFEGSRWNLRMPNSQTAPERVMTIDKYNLDVEGHHRYVFLYPNDPLYGLHFFNFFNSFNNKLSEEELAKLKESQEQTDDEQTQNLAVCAPDPDNGGSIEALVYEGVYVDMTTGEAKDAPGIMQIACVSGGTGKAGLWNFLPYNLGLEAFETGVRMVRADYCGDGDSYTQPGNQLYLRDVFGMHDFGQAANNTTEAIMSRKGALCLDTPRDANFDYWSVDCGSGPLLPCKDAKLEDFAPDGLMHSKLAW